MVSLKVAGVCASLGTASRAVVLTFECLINWVWVAVRCLLLMVLMSGLICLETSILTNYLLADLQIGHYGWHKQS